VVSPPTMLSTAKIARIDLGSLGTPCELALIVKKKKTSRVNGHIRNGNSTYPTYDIEATF